MSKRATVTEAEYRRAIKAAIDCGLKVRECELTPSKVRLIFINVDEPAEPGDTAQPKEWPR